MKVTKGTEEVVVGSGPRVLEDGPGMVSEDCPEGCRRGKETRREQGRGRGRR